MYYQTQQHGTLCMISDPAITDTSGDSGYDLWADMHIYNSSVVDTDGRKLDELREELFFEARPVYTSVH